MTRVYRIEIDERAQLVVERDGAWHRLDGDLFGEHRSGESFGTCRGCGCCRR